MSHVSELELRSKRDTAVPVDVVGVFLEAGVIVAADGFAEIHDALGHPEVFLAVLAQTVFAAGRKRVWNRIYRIVYSCQNFLDILQFQTADGRGDALEVFFHEFRSKTDRLEDARATVGAQRGNAHLRHDLHNAFAHGGDVIRGHLMRR